MVHPNWTHSLKDSRASVLRSAQPWLQSVRGTGRTTEIRNALPAYLQAHVELRCAPSLNESHLQLYTSLFQYPHVAMCGLVRWTCDRSNYVLWLCRFTIELYEWNRIFVLRQTALFTSCGSNMKSRLWFCGYWLTASTGYWPSEAQWSLYVPPI
jgi:hypothetical protein